MLHRIKSAKKSKTVFLLDTRGAGMILLTIGLSLAGLILGASVLLGVGKQRNLQRQISRQRRADKLIQLVLTQTLNDLRFASHFPDAQGLPSPPQPRLSKSPGTTLSGLRCGKRDPTSGCRFNLDAYLSPTCLDVFPVAGYTTNVKTFTYAGNLPQFQSNTDTPDSGATTIMQPQGNVTVTVSKVTGVREKYRLQINFSVCDYSLNQMIRCLPMNQQPVRYDGIIDTNTQFFQQCPPCPRAASGNCYPIPTATGFPNNTGFGCPAC